MRAIKILWKCLQVILLALLALLLLLNLYRIASGNASVFGWSWAVVLSGSMEPEISVDDLIVNHRQSSYEVGDIITFHNSSSLTTHRIVGVDAEGFSTQGDANNAPDSRKVTQDRILGKVILTVPGIGRAVRALKSPLGMTVLVLTGFGLIQLPYLFKKNSEGCKHENEEQ